MSHASVCYFLFIPSSNRWKIGRSSLLVERIAAHMKEHPQSVLRAVFWEAELSERKCLRQFASHCVHGKEWFKDAPEFQSFLDAKKDSNLLQYPVRDHREIYDVLPAVYPPPPGPSAATALEAFEPLYYSTEEMAAMIGSVVTPEDLRELVKAGKMRAYRIGPRGHFLFKKNEAFADFEMSVEAVRAEMRRNGEPK